jgi:hypothetical protein
VDDIDLNPFRRRLLKHGRPANARVLEAEISLNQSPGSMLTRRYVVEVQPEGEAPFQTQIKDAFSMYWAPKRGDLLKVRFNPRTHKAAFDLKGDPRYDASLQKLPGQWTEGEAPPPSIFGTGPVGAPAATDIAATFAAAFGTGTPSVEQRLAQLAALRDGGAITLEEYEAQRTRILGSI